MRELTADRLREVLTYTPETGVFTRRETTSKRLKPGCRAGTKSVTGYIRINVDGVIYPAHRLAWLYTYGTWPAHDIDHANLDRADNRLSNLRAASRSQNTANGRLRADTSSGFKGVYQSSNGKWLAQIRANGHLHSLGRFETPELAHKAYAAKAIELFGEFARVA